MIRSSVFLVCLALLVGGCQTPPALVQGQNLQVVEGSVLPPPHSKSQGNDYRIGAFDKLQIDVFGLEELSKKIQVDGSGRISLPMAGSIEAAGKTPEELAGAIRSSLQGAYVKNPQVSVNVDEVQSQMITVDGEVNGPGLYPIQGRMTLMRAIARAKGTTEFARQSHVVIFRTVEQQEMAALYDLRAIRQGAYQDPEVYADDVVVVGSSQARRWFRDIVASSGLLLSPVIALIQR